MRNILNIFKKKENFGIDIDAPIKKTRHYFNDWLKTNDIKLDNKTKKKVAALIAYYFEHEDELNRTMVFNFLNMIKDNKFTISPDNIEAHQAKIQGFIECARPEPSKWLYIGILTLSFTFTILCFIYHTQIEESFYKSVTAKQITHNTIITTKQAYELKELVLKIAEAENTPNHITSTSSIWDDAKFPLQVSYKELPRYAFKHSKKALELRYKISMNIAR